MKHLLLFVIALLTGCSSTTGPKGLDPTVLATNDSGPLSVQLTWFDQSGQVSTFSIPKGTSQCIHFTSTQIADSVRFVAAMGTSSLDTLPGTPGTVWTKDLSPWFDPKTGLPTAGPGQYPFGAENWMLSVTARNAIGMWPVNGPPC